MFKVNSTIYCLVFSIIALTSSGCGNSHVDVNTSPNTVNNDIKIRHEVLDIISPVPINPKPFVMLPVNVTKKYSKVKNRRF
jgi:hypothetical protein